MISGGDAQNGMPEEEPCSAKASEGLVEIDGPKGIEMRMTPGTALKTAQNLSDAAIDALASQPTPKK